MNCTLQNGVGTAFREGAPIMSLGLGYMDASDLSPIGVANSNAG